MSAHEHHLRRHQLPIWSWLRLVTHQHGESPAPQVIGDINAGKTMLELFDCSTWCPRNLQSGGQNPGDIVRVYTAIDDCGNESTFEQFISVVD